MSRVTLMNDVYLYSRCPLSSTFTSHGVCWTLVLAVGIVWVVVGRARSGGCVVCMQRVK